jgi:hypothetical protein
VSQQTTNRYFDELASGLASGSISRGRALRLMGAALVGGTIGSLGIRGAFAADQDDQGENEDCKAEGKKCRRNGQCCSGRCVNDTCAPAVTFSSITCDSVGPVERTIGCATADCSMADAVCNIVCQDVGGGVSIGCVPNPSFC